jgi:hypothetical protein
MLQYSIINMLKLVKLRQVGSIVFLVAIIALAMFVAQLFGGRSVLEGMESEEEEPEVKEHEETAEQFGAKDDDKKKKADKKQSEDTADDRQPSPSPSSSSSSLYSSA